MSTEQLPPSNEHGRSKGNTLTAQLTLLEALGRTPGSSPSKAIQAMRTLSATALRMGLHSLAQRAVESAKQILLQRLPNDAELASGLDQLAAQVRTASSVAIARTAQEGISTVSAVPVATVARESLLRAIHNSLSEGLDKNMAHRAVIRATAGYGKTVAALQYSAAYADAYPGGRFFISATSRDVVAAIASLAAPLNLKSTNDPAPDAALVAATLREGEPSLLILDDVTSAAAWTEMVATGLVPTGNCRVLITTRDEALGPANAVNIDRLSPEEAREIYNRVASSSRDAPSDHTADTITSLLGGLPVAIAATATLMKMAPGFSWADFALRLEKATITPPPPQSETEGVTKGIGETIPPEVSRTNSVISEALAALPPVERRAIEYASLLPEDLTPSVWLEALLQADFARDSELRQPISFAVTDERSNAARAALLNLDQLGAIAPAGEDGKLLALHPLWRSCLQRRLQADAILGSQLWDAIAACVSARRDVIIGRDADGADRGVNNPIALTVPSLQWELGPLAAVCQALWAVGKPASASQIGVWLASVLRDLGRLDEAATCLLPVLDHEDAVEQALGSGELAACYANLATIQQDQGDLLAARASMERAIAIQSQRFAPDDPVFASSYNNLAMILKDLGELNEALRYKRLSMELERKCFGEDYPQLGASYSNLAMVQQALGDLPAARASLELAISFDRKHFAPNHPTFATRYSNLAMIQKAEGDLPGARASIEHAIAIEMEHFTPNHPGLATRYSNLATIQKDQGDLLGARASLERAIAIGERHLGTQHSNLATMRSNLSTIQQAQGDLPGALASIEQAITIWSKHLAAEHPNFGSAYSNLAAVQHALGRLPEARESMMRAIAIDQKHFGLDHPVFATRYSNLAAIQKSQGNLPEAVANMQRAIAIQEKHLAADHPHFGSSYSNMALLQRAQGDLRGARASMTRAIAIQEKHFAPDHPNFANIYNNLAHIYKAEGNRAAACANFKKALAVLLTHFGENHPHVEVTRASMKTAGCEE